MSLGVLSPIISSVLLFNCKHVSHVRVFFALFHPYFQTLTYKHLLSQFWAARRNMPVLELIEAPLQNEGKLAILIQWRLLLEIWRGAPVSAAFHQSESKHFTSPMCQMSDDKHQIDSLSASGAAHSTVGRVHQTASRPADTRWCLCSFAVCSTLTSLGVPTLADASWTHESVLQSAQLGVLSPLPSAALCTAGNVSTPLLTRVGLCNVKRDAATHSHKQHKSHCGTLWDIAPLESITFSCWDGKKVAILYTLIGTLILYFFLSNTKNSFEMEHTIHICKIKITFCPLDGAESHQI